MTTDKDNTTQHISDVIALLNSGTEYAVLRNYDQLPDGNTSRDIDIIISRKGYSQSRDKLINTLVANDWKILVYLHSDRLISYVMGHSNDDGVEIVQWDFFFDTSVFGITLMTANEFLSHRSFNGFLYHVDTECEFLDKYLYNRAVGHLYPKKYENVRNLIENSQLVNAKLKAIFGTKDIKKCDKTSKLHLISHAFLSNFIHNPFKAIYHILYFLYTFIRNYIRCNTGFSIGFTGPDGVGKSTVIDTMINFLSPVFSKAHVYFHFRPSLFGNISDVAHASGLKKSVDKDYSNPHRGNATNSLSSFARLMYYSIDYIFGYFLKVKPVIRITRIAIFDRYYTDIICDSHRSRIFLNYKFLYWFGRLFIPRLDYNILLTADTDTILQRKAELNSAQINTINHKIDYLNNRKGYLKILNDGVPAKTSIMIINHILNLQHLKNIKRLHK